ncbi:MAG: S4 domain-containing protein [Bacteroidota bacterium]
MRIDKYLWCTRYFKTRNLATIACKKGQVKVNDNIAKPSRDIYITDKITVRKEQINYSLIVNDIPPNRVGAKLVDIYRTDTTPKEAFATKDLLKYSKDYYRKKGTGRPTKKDRRDIDGFYDEHE